MGRVDHPVFKPEAANHCSSWDGLGQRQRRNRDGGQQPTMPLNAIIGRQPEGVVLIGLRHIVCLFVCLFVVVVSAAAGAVSGAQPSDGGMQSGPSKLMPYLRSAMWRQNSFVPEMGLRGPQEAWAGREGGRGTSSKGCRRLREGFAVVRRFGRRSWDDATEVFKHGTSRQRVC